jgi:hypothetical protein
MKIRIELFDVRAGFVPPIFFMRMKKSSAGIRPAGCLAARPTGRKISATSIC